MAKNLRLKIPVQDSLIIYDVNATTTKNFHEDLGAFSNRIAVAKNVEEVVANSVCLSSSPFLNLPRQQFGVIYDEYVPSMNCLSLDLHFGVSVHDSIPQSQSSDCKAENVNYIFTTIFITSIILRVSLIKFIGNDHYYAS